MNEDLLNFIADREFISLERSKAVAAQAGAASGLVYKTGTEAIAH